MVVLFHGLDKTYDFDLAKEKDMPDHTVPNKDPYMKPLSSVMMFFSETDKTMSLIIAT